MTAPAAFVLDLDDTLLDTSGLLVPAADRRAIAAMQARGLGLTVEAARAELTRLRAAGTGDLYGELARRHGAGAACGAAGTDAFLRFPVPHLALEPAVAGALAALAALAPLVLLTAGDEATQRTKVARLGIAPRFSECLYVPNGEKESALRALLGRRGWPPHGVVVVGDRATSEIRAGNRLGCTTILVRRPGAEYAAHEPQGTDRPTHEVSGVEEILALFR